MTAHPELIIVSIILMIAALFMIVVRWRQIDREYKSRMESLETRKARLHQAFAEYKTQVERYRNHEIDLAEVETTYEKVVKIIDSERDGL